jgi:NADH-quinone oxidoreductase subunit L
VKLFDWLPLIPFFPLLGFLINTALGPRLRKGAIAAVGCGMVALALGAAVACFIALVGLPAEERSVTTTLYTWMAAGTLDVPVAFLFDPLSATMTLVVTGVGFLIHLYSVGYMGEDEGFARFFSYLNLFTFAMLVLVLANNYLLMFVGWEGVGLCSYLLIGFWFDKTANADAGKKAFVVNRVGDFGFILGMLLLWTSAGSFVFADVNRVAPTLPTGVLTAVTLLFFLGATGKSAQIPLYVWLPDAMAGPTPVSALIHAATMVTAGVYMVARSHVLYTLAPFSGAVVATIGALTALLAASIALVQNDIKKVLAYSTVSQLGYMFLAVGCGAYVAGIFHLVTHAFFKALLFLGAGAVIHVLHHAFHHTHDHRSDPNDIRLMGGLRSFMPVTGVTVLVASLAIAGVPPLAGFFSKDEILAHTAGRGGGYWLLWGIGMLTALMTAFYTTRLYLLVFEGQNRLPEAQRHHLEKPPLVMEGPLVVLAVLAAFGGALGVPQFLDFLGFGHRLDAWLEPVVGTPAGPHLEMSGTFEGSLALLSVLAALAGIVGAWTVYGQGLAKAQSLRERFPRLHRYLANKWFVDEVYEAFIVEPVQRLGQRLWSLMDVKLIDGAVNGIAGFFGESSQDFRRVQTGNVQVYLYAMCGGALFVLLYLLLAT